MNGQWLGRYSGSNSGLLVIDFDDLGTHYEGRAFAYDDNYPALPATFSFIKTPGKANAFDLPLDLLPVNPRTGDPALSWDQVAALYPSGIAFPRRATVNISMDEGGGVLRVKWQTDIGTFGSAEIPKSRAREPTEYQPLSDVSTWEKYKAYVNSLEHRRHIFRGQRELLRLRTGFHRTGRADLARFLANDIQTLYRHLRHKGQLLLRQGHAEPAEELYRRALSIAQEQEAKLWELRAATNLARLRRDQGRRAEARDLLAPIYGWFTEGFDTPDLKEAKALLDVLR